MTNSTKKTKKPAKKTITKDNMSFYIYRWNDEFTTFVVAENPKHALEIIEASKDIACPPELKNIALVKKNLKKADPKFILTISSPEMTDEEMDELEEKTSSGSMIN